jgi:hypothetical protein
MDSLISMMSTGTPAEFAEKLGIRRSTLFQSLQEMKVLGVDIRYSYNRQSYYYEDNRRIRIKVETSILRSFQVLQPVRLMIDNE